MRRNKSLIGAILLSFFVFCLFPVITAEPAYTLRILPSEQYPKLCQPLQMILYEDFTATWCGWCHFSYEIFEKLYEEYGDRILQIRYHNQDTISMPNIKERRDFYKVTGYPTMVFNGNNKIIGADETTYPAVKKLADSLIQQTPLIGLNSFGVANGNKLQMTVIIQSFVDVPVTGHLLTVFTENQVVDDQDNEYQYVSRYAFPDFKGIPITIEPNKTYFLKFSQSVSDPARINQFQAVTFFQDFSTNQIYNSCLYSFGSLQIMKCNIAPFESDVKRDVSIELSFAEGLIISTIKDDLFLLADQYGNTVKMDSEYDSINKVLHFYPEELLKKNTGYAFYITGKKDSLNGVLKHFIRTNYVIPFNTSEYPDLNIQLSDLLINLGEVWPIDTPTFSLEMEEKNGNSVRIKVQSKVPWITVQETVFIASKKTINLSFRPDMMKPGINLSSIMISTQTGNLYIPVQANLFKPDYPLIRFTQFPSVTSYPSVVISGKTDGYRVFLFGEEISVDLQGKFSAVTKVQSGLNVYIFYTMNMQRKIGKFPVFIAGITGNAD